MTKNTLGLFVSLVLFIFGHLIGQTTHAQSLNFHFGNRHPVAIDAINSPANIKLGFHTIPTPMPSAGAQYLVPEVCTDAAGFPNTIDVASPLCAFKRKLRIGEPLLTYRTDRAWDQKYMHTLNIPLLKGASLRVLNSREFGNNSSIDQASVPEGIFKRRFFDFDFYTGGDGYDVIEADGPFVSMIGTADPVTSNTNRNLATRKYSVPEFFWVNSQNVPADSWIAFRSDLLLNASEYFVALLGGTTSLTTRPPLSKSGTIYTNYPLLGYSNGKLLNTIQSWHYSDEILWTSATSTKPLDHLETFRFNKEYGLSRWERFETPQGCLKTIAFHNQALPVSQQLDPNVECSEATMMARSQMSKDCDNGSGVIINPFYQKFMRYSCRDWTYNEVYDLPQHPFWVPISEQFITTRNLILQSDFAEGQFEKWQSLPGGGANNNTVLSTVEMQRQNFNSFAGRLSCSACLGNSIYQDIDPRVNVANQATRSLQIQAGVRIQGQPGTHVSLVLFLFDSAGRQVMKSATQILSPRVHATLTSQEADVLSFNLPWNFATTPLSRIRFQIYFTTPNNAPGSLIVDDAFLALLPQN